VAATKQIEVLFSPGEYSQLKIRDLKATTAVVFDILRATTTMLTALANGADEIVPVSEISEALALRSKEGKLLLAGERGGLRIRRELTGGVDFDFGNSPREFLNEKVKGRRIAITTTNGTRALRACSDAAEIHIGAFLNLAALAEVLRESRFSQALIICAGTAQEASLEDTLAAGALCELLDFELQDSAQIALATYARHKSDLANAFSLARNGQRLLSIPELRDDVAFCLRRDTLKLTARMGADGVIRRS
jgi:2-phosphosulfolactate phosphatase